MKANRAYRHAAYRLAAGTVTAALAGAVFATPPVDTVGTIMARAGFMELVDVKFKVGTPPEILHVVQAGDTVMQRIVVGPGGQTGWHSHPGPAIALVTRGELTLYSGHDPSCMGHSYGVGQSFVDSGQGHVHLAGNLGSEEAEVWVTYLDVPPGGGVRVDAADPGYCSF